MNTDHFHRKHLNPLNNPVLHVLALKNSNNFNKNQLPDYARKELKKLKEKLKENHHKSVNNIVHSHSLEALATSLSGSSLPSVKVKQSNVNNSPRKYHPVKSKSPGVDIKFNDESSKSLGEVKPKLSTHEPTKKLTSKKKSKCYISFDLFFWSQGLRSQVIV
uniref:Uncharacterized protein n=1 Tax=Trichobilharzia regenti TaxID=157069 RepID=A0AA85JPG1_TRIRE|nr:unnamed protein product [Trichobilharzia regenti]